MHQRLDISGNRYGRLLAVTRTCTNAQGCSLWHCRCDCGVDTTVTLSNLRRGITRSCGCLRKEWNAAHKSPDKQAALCENRRRAYANRKDSRCCVKCGKKVLLRENTVWCNACANYHRWQTRKRMMGMTADIFWQVFKEQKGCCAICTDPLPPEDHKIHVDHNHETHQWRGLLCSGCNRGLGQFRDNPDTCDRAADYLRLRNPTAQSH